jgi:threonyl-tRNA synthetase
MMNSKELDLETLRHSTSHVMAQAVMELFPGVKLGIGPAIEDGFYYDFDLQEKLSPEDLPKIEAKMKEIVKKNHKFERTEVSKTEAIALFEERGERYKVELLKEIEGDKVSLYKHDNFVDLCRGPHIGHTGQIKAFKLYQLPGPTGAGSRPTR